MNTKINNKGFTLVELVITMVILVIIVLSVMKIQYFMSRQTIRIKEKAFATQKVIQMMEELRSLVSGSEKEKINVLDDYDDGVAYKPVLTTDKNVTDPSTVSSDNVSVSNGWKYVRRISVFKVPEESFVRKVYVRVYRSSPSNPSASPEILAETMSILKTISSPYVPTQVMDLYVLAIENVPGWWTNLWTMRPMFEGIIQDLQTRCTGFEIRTHWITRLSYGRDQQYLPYINRADFTGSIVMPSVYLYPGKTQKVDGGEYYFYDPDRMQCRVNVDGVPKNGPVTDAKSYAMSDRYNNAVRYPDELRIYNAAVAATPLGNPPPEISLRMLLEELNSGDINSNKNIILVNLHGELLPVPPIRNYSDAAKDPQSFPYERVVSHPENLRYPNNSNITLRVYAYFMDPGSHPGNPTLPVATVFIPDKNIPTGSIEVTRIVGSDSVNYQSSVVTEDPARYEVSHPIVGTTLIKLYNTPLRHPEAPDNTGLSVAQWVYGLEYIPCPVGNDFSQDLTDNHHQRPKNTARWIIKFTNTLGALNGMNTFETRIGNDLTTGTPLNKPSNLSRTYTWVGVTPPLTEQYQLLGDARHCPYADVKQRHGYNWYFAAVPSGPNDYNGFDKTQNGWNGQLEIDIPRIFSIYRQGLLRTQAIWSSINGFCYFYYGLGGEFGSNTEPIENSMAFGELPWITGSGVGVIYVDEIWPGSGVSAPFYGGVTDTTSRHPNSRIVAKKDNNWYSRYWLGELYPDNVFATQWNINGNLPTGISPNEYYRAQYTTFGDFNTNRLTVTADRGCTTFLNGGSVPGKYFRHMYGGNGNITALGTYISTIFSFPLLDAILADRPFKLDDTGDEPDEWNDAIYSSQRTILSIPVVGGVSRTYYDSTRAGCTASSTVRVSSGTVSSFYLSVSGFAIQANFGAAQIGKFALTSVFRTFLDAGLYTGQDWISQVPLVAITNPTNVHSTFSTFPIIIESSINWKRWGNEDYTEEYTTLAPSYSETTPLVYSIKYSSDRGATWHYCDDNSLTTAGHKDTFHDNGTSYSWDVSDAALFPKGSYIVRVECYRRNLDLHYSYDQIQIYIQR
ncbi:MAG: type II secretion system protein [Elusimicrobia bacterium]|nr:type II secretion system protein [Elusimicrobiota bacterium]